MLVDMLRRSLWSSRTPDDERSLPHLDTFVDENIADDEIRAACEDESDPHRAAFRTPVTLEALRRTIG